MVQLFAPSMDHMCATRKKFVIRGKMAERERETMFQSVLVLYSTMNTNGTLRTTKVVHEYSTILSGSPRMCIVLEAVGIVRGERKYPFHFFTR